MRPFFSSAGTALASVLFFAFIFSVADPHRASARERWNHIPGPWWGEVGRFALDPSDGTLFALLGTDRILRSVDDGRTWNVAAAVGNDTIRSIACGDGHVWIGTQTGKLLRSDDLANSWTIEQTWEEKPVIGIAHREGRLYVSVDGIGIMESNPERTLFRFLFGYAFSHFFEHRSTLAVTRRGRIWLLPRHEEFDLEFSRWKREDFSRIDAHDSLLYVQIGNSLYSTPNEGKDYTGPLIDDIESYEWWLADGMLFAARTEPDGPLLRSTDNGRTWREVAKPFPAVRTIFSAGGILFAGTLSEGIYRSVDSGMSWRQVGGYQHAVKRAVFVGDTIVVGTGTLFRKKQGEPGWERITIEGWESGSAAGLYRGGGDTLLAVDGEHQQDNFRQEYNIGRLYYSTDRGSTWATYDTASRPYGNIAHLRGTYFMVYSKKLLTAPELRGPWTEIPAERFGSTVTAMLSTPPATFGDYLYARALDYPDGSPTGRTEAPLFRSGDAGTTWERIDTGVAVRWLYPYGEIAQGPDRLLYRIDSSVIRLLDPVAGTATTLRFNEPGQRIGRYTACPDRIFIAAEYPYGENDYRSADTAANAGVFITTDGGATWTQNNEGLIRPPLRFTSEFLWRTTPADSTLFLRTPDGMFYYGEEEPEPLYRLTVLNGLGSGNFHAGDTAHIFAREMGESEVFGEWTPSENRDRAAITYPKEWHTTLVMPARDVTVRGDIRPVRLPAAQVDTLALEAVPYPVVVRSIIPDTPCALLCLFHDVGETSANWTDDVERAQFIRDALAAGAGVVAFDAQEIAAGDLDGNGSAGWLLTEPASTNGDMVAVQEALAELYPDMIGIPRLAAGIGRGAKFASILPPLLNFRASALFASAGYEPGQDGALDRYHSPAILVVPVNTGTEQIAAADRTVRRIRDNGVAAEALYHYPSPLYPERFARIGSTDRSTSLALFTEMKAGGLIDNRNFLSVPPGTALSLMIASPAYPAFNRADSVRREQIVRQLNAAFAGHEFASDYNKSVLEFLLGHVKTGGVKPEEAGTAGRHELYMRDNGGMRETGFVLFERAWVTVALYDLTGRRAAEIFSGILGPGKHSLISPAAAGNGVYILSLAADGRYLESVPVVRLR